MKVRVTYTEHFTEHHLQALTDRGQKRITRNELRQMLEDLGRLGVEELISHARPRDLHREDEIDE